MRQGNDVGTQYRSGIWYTTTSRRRPPRRHATCSRQRSRQTGYGEITTEIAAAGPFFYAEDYHQQYLDKNPNGYCGLGGTGVSCPVGVSWLWRQEPHRDGELSFDVMVNSRSTG